MTDTPRVPDLWWSPGHWLFLASAPHRYYSFVTDRHVDELPADAVKLVPEDACEDDTPCAVCEIAADLNRAHGDLYLLRQTLRAMLSAYDSDLSSPRDVVDALRALLDEKEG